MGDKVGENPAACSAAVFLLSAKNRRGGGVETPPSRAKVKSDENMDLLFNPRPAGPLDFPRPAGGGGGV